MPIRTYDDGTIIAEGAESTRLYSLVALKGRLKLEIAGMKGRGQSALTVAKRVTGLRTNDRAAQIKRIEEIVEEIHERGH